MNPIHGSERYIGMIECRGDDAELYDVDHWVSVADHGASDLPDATPEDLAALYCEGRPVRRVGPGRYVTLDGMELRTDDPTAP